MIKNYNLKEEMKKIIQENQDKTLNELKNMIKSKLPKDKRERFTFNHLMQLISEINQEREKDRQVSFRQKKGYFRRIKNTKNIEGEER